MASPVQEEHHVAPWRQKKFVWRTAAWIVACWAYMLGGTVALISIWPRVPDIEDNSGIWAFVIAEGGLILLILFCATWMVARTPDTYQPGDGEPAKARKLE